MGLLDTILENRPDKLPTLPRNQPPQSTRGIDVPGLLTNRLAQLPSLLENTRALEAEKTGLISSSALDQRIGNLQRGQELMPTDSQIIRELGGGRTGQTRQRERVPSVILKAQEAERMHYFAPRSATPEKTIRVIERMKRMGASENDQIMFLELLNLHGRPDLAKMLWNRYFPQNIDENS